jgi:hypothetical protein
MQKFPIVVYPGGENSDSSKNELVENRHVRVLNAVVDIKGEWTNAPGLRSCVTEELIDAILLPIGKVLNAVEWSGYLIVQTDVEPYLWRVEIDSSGRYHSGDGCVPIESPFELYASDVLTFIPTPSVLRVYVEREKSYFLIHRVQPKQIKAPDGNVLYTSPDDGIGTLSTAVVGQGRAVDVSEWITLHSSDAQGQSVNIGFYSGSVASVPEEAIKFQKFSAFIAIAVVDELGQIHPAILPPSSGGGKDPLEVSGLVFRSTAAVNANAERWFSFDIDIDTTKIPSWARSIAVFATLSALPYILSEDNYGPGSIAGLDEKYPWKFIEEIPLENSENDAYLDRWDKIEKDFIERWAMRTPTEIDIPLLDSYDDEKNNEYVSRGLWRAAMLIGVGTYVSFVLYDGLESPRVRVVGREIFFSSDETIVRLILDQPVAAIRNSVGQTTVDDSFTIKIFRTHRDIYLDETYPSSRRPYLTDNMITTRVGVDLGSWSLYDDMLNQYPYNIFSPSIYPEVDLYRIVNKQGLAITTDTKERGFMRYSPDKSPDILPADQVAQISATDVLDIVSRRNAIAMITPQGIIQGGLVSGIFEADIEYTRSGAISGTGHLTIDGVLFYLGSPDLFLNDGNASRPVLESLENRKTYQQELGLNRDRWPISFIAYDRGLNWVIVKYSSVGYIVINQVNGDVYRMTMRYNNYSVDRIFMNSSNDLRMITNDGKIVEFDVDYSEGVANSQPMSIHTRLIDIGSRYKTKKLKEVVLPISGKCQHLQVVFRDLDDDRYVTWAINNVDSDVFRDYRFYPGFLFRNLQVEISDMSSGDDQVFSIKPIKMQVSAW